MAFTMQQPGLPPRPAGTVALTLPCGEFDEARKSAFLARQSYRHFEGPRLSICVLGAWLGTLTTEQRPSCARDVPLPPHATPTLEALGHWLARLQALPAAGALLPKRLYPSAGGLYPVRAYLDLRQAHLTGGEPGLYFYHPDDHCLISGAGGAHLAPTHGS